jgi:hypothetical protein
LWHESECHPCEMIYVDVHTDPNTSVRQAAMPEKNRREGTLAPSRDSSIYLIGSTGSGHRACRWPRDGGFPAPEHGVTRPRDARGRQKGAPDDPVGSTGKDGGPPWTQDGPARTKRMPLGSPIPRSASNLTRFQRPGTSFRSENVTYFTRWRLYRFSSQVLSF